MPVALYPLICVPFPKRRLFLSLIPCVSPIPTPPLETNAVALVAIGPRITNGVTFNENVAMRISIGGTAAIPGEGVRPSDVDPFANAAFDQIITHRNIMGFAHVVTDRIIRHRGIK